MRRKYFRLKKIALGLAFAAVLVPTAQAKPVSGTPAHKPIASEISVQSPVFVPSRHLPQEDIQAINAPTSSAPAKSPVSQLQVQGMRWQAMANEYIQAPVRSENSFGAPGPSAAGAQGPVSVALSTTSDSFSWSDAGIGASVTFGASLLLLMAVALGRRRSGSGPAGLASA